MDNHYTLWVKTHCPFCKKAKDLLYENKIDHTVLVMDNKLEELDKLKEMWNHFTVPLIVLQRDEEEELIGGFSDLKNLLESGGQDD